MRHFPLVVVTSLLCLFSGIATAQSPPLLCVANMDSGPGGGTTGQDLLLKFLDKGKNKSVTQTLPIKASEAAPALDEAKGAHCDYLVTTKQTESHQENSLMSGAAFGATSTPTFFVATAYKLTKVGDGSDVSSGTIKASDHGSEQDAVAITLHKVADKVTDAIKKAGH